MVPDWRKTAGQAGGRGVDTCCAKVRAILSRPVKEEGLMVMFQKCASSTIISYHHNHIVRAMALYFKTITGGAPAALWVMCNVFCNLIFYHTLCSKTAKVCIVRWHFGTVSFFGGPPSRHSLFIPQWMPPLCFESKIFPPAPGLRRSHLLPLLLLQQPHCLAGAGREIPPWPDQTFLKEHHIIFVTSFGI